MKKISKSMLILFVVGSLNAFDIGKYTSSTGDVDYFSKINDQVTDCVAGMISDGVPEFDICTIEDKINQISDELDSKIKSALRINVKFSIAGCSFSAKADPSRCMKDLLKSYCSNSDNPLQKSKIKNGVENYLTTATAKYAEYGDSEILGKACITFEEKKKKMPAHTKVYGSTKYENIMAKKDGGKYVNTRVEKKILQCIEDAKKNNYDENSCYPEYDGVNADETKTKISEVEIREKIHEQATIVLASPLKDKIGEMRNKELDLKNKLLKECGDKSSVSSADSCVESFLKDSYQINRLISETQIDITKNIAGFSKAVEDATTPYNTMVQPTENTLKKLPIEKKNDYKIRAVRYMAQRAVIQSQIKKIARIERELAALMYRKIEIASKPFPLKAVKKELGIK